jgi:CRISPR-associated protein Cmr5
MNEAGGRRTLEQERAAFALERVELLKKHGDKAREAAMYIRKLPAMTFTNGLGQALAFLLAKAENDGNFDPARQVYLIIADWLIERKIYLGESADLIRTMMANDRYQYQLAQEEAWALLEWLKKFADALLPKEETISAMVQGKGSEADDVASI